MEGCTAYLPAKSWGELRLRGEGKGERGGGILPAVKGFSGSKDNIFVGLRVFM
jgi:hypothetical protein